MKEPIEKVDLSKNLSPICIYEKLNKKISYILSVDPSEGLALNNNAFTLINPHTQCVAAEYKSPYISPPDFFRMIVKFMDNYCPKSMIVVEANRGRELINRFMESKYRYQLWYDSKKLTAKVVETTDKFGAERRSANERRAFGFDTTPSSKPLLFSIIERIMEEDLNMVYTQYIVKDITCVQRQPNGKIILGAGDDDEGVGHGDNLMSYLIGLYVLYNADNLEEFGINPGASAPIDTDRELTEEEQKQVIINAMANMPPEMQELFASVLNQKDPVQDSYNHEMEVQREIRKQNFEMGISEDEQDMRFSSESADDLAWENTQRNIFDAYFERQNDPGSKFDINDWI